MGSSTVAWSWAASCTSTKAFFALLTMLSMLFGFCNTVLTCLSAVLHQLASCAGMAQLCSSGWHPAFALSVQEMTAKTFLHRRSMINTAFWPLTLMLHVVGQTSVWPVAAQQHLVPCLCAGCCR
jgi:hypothetical protein